MTYALDTNIIIHLLRNTPETIFHLDNALELGCQIVIPPYVDFEIRRGLRYANATAKEKLYEHLCNSCEMGEMRREIWILAADLYSTLRRDSFTVGDADLLIAAFCMLDKYTLVTNNTKDFDKFSGLQLLDWTK